jgi:hypothetical protein
MLATGVGLSWADAVDVARNPAPMASAAPASGMVSRRVLRFDMAISLRVVELIRRHDAEPDR